MFNAAWRQALKTCADPERTRRWLEKLQSAAATSLLAKVSAGQARVLAALFSGSEVLGEAFVSHPYGLAPDAFDPEHLRHPRQKQGLEREVEAWLKPQLEAREPAPALAALRRFRQREMLRIAARDLAGLGDVPSITLEISNLADVCLQSLYRILSQQLVQRFGAPYHQDVDGAWRPTAFSVIGLGKLGGQELNYSSDVDVVFIYSDEGSVFHSPPAPSEAAGHGLTNHQFFTRLAEAMIAELTRLTPEGALFRIDLRLRPEGDAGPLVRSLASYENYYAQWGQTWERMMLIKARGVAGQAALAAEFLEMVQPFRYPRSLGERALREVALMKRRLETEVLQPDEVERNVKLGRGGIREIEFLAQTAQLLHAGKAPFLQVSQTLPALAKLVQYGVFPAADAQSLAAAYVFLRKLEHRLQMEANLQTHTVPTDQRSRERLAALMGFATLGQFERAWREQKGQVREIFEKFFKTSEPEPQPGLPPEFEGHEAAWQALLRQHSFRDPEKAQRLLAAFVHGPGYVHLSSRTVELARDLIVRLLSLCPHRAETTVEPATTPKRSPRCRTTAASDLAKVAAPQDARTPARRSACLLSDPDRVVVRLDSFVAAYGARATLFDLWASKPPLFDLLVLLFDRSEFLAELAIRVPDLVDELELSGQLRRTKGVTEIVKDLRHGRADPDQRLWLRRYHQAEFMRIGLRDILGLADEEQNLVELSALAEACLQHALEVVLHGRRYRKPPLAVIGLGKLGGAEVTYGSDLDLLFVAEPGVKNLAPLQALAAKVMDLLSAQTELGVTFATDARLRPDGAKGLLINSLPAYEDYYRHRAQLWEIQSLTRARPVAGNPEVGRNFQALAAALTNFGQPSLPLAAYTADWKGQIAAMRRRIEQERVPAGKQALAFKTGVGGLMDVEFVAQVLCLSHGWQEPNTLRALQKAAASGVLPEAAVLIENFRKLRRLECILRRWSYVGESELPDDPAARYRVAVRCGFATADDLMKAVAGYRTAIRGVYQKVLG